MKPLVLLECWGVLEPSGAVDGPCGPYEVLGVLEDCLVRLEEFLWSWCP
jgi:hypothetical protein